MTKLRLVLLATTALTAMQFASAASHAQSAPLVVAQQQPQGEVGPDGKPKQPPKGPPAQQPPARPAPPPAAAPPRPAPPPPPAAAPPRPPPPPPPAPPPHPAAPPPTRLTNAPPGNAPPGNVPPGSPPPAAGAPSNQSAPPPAGAPIARRPPPTVTAPIPAAPPPAQALTPIAPGAAPQGPRRMEDFRSQRHEVQEGGRTVITEPGRIIIRDPSGQQIVRHDELDRFRFGARDIRTEKVGGESRTIVIRPDRSHVITPGGRDGPLLRRIPRHQQGRLL